MISLGAPGLDGYDILEIVEELAPMDFATGGLHRAQRPGQRHVRAPLRHPASALCTPTVGCRICSSSASCPAHRAAHRDGPPHPSLHAPREDEILPLDPLRRTITIQAYARNLEHCAWIRARAQPSSSSSPSPTSLPGLIDHLRARRVPRPLRPRPRPEDRSEPAAAVDILRLLRDRDPACVRA